MENEIKTYLYDILNAIEEIYSFFDDKLRVFDNYTKDIRTKRAVERDLAIIGEAINRMLQRDNSIHIENSRKIIGLRNRIIHSYDNITDEHIWAIVINDLPKLKKEVAELLKQ